MIIEFEMNEIMPACIMEKLSAERKIEKEKEAEIARQIEEERKNNIRKNIIKNSNTIILQINKALKEHGSIEIQTGHFDDNTWGCEYLTWHLNDVHYVGHQYDIVKNVYNNELIDCLYELYKEAGYKVHWYTYSSNYYKNYSLTIYAKANCDTCEF